MIKKKIVGILNIAMSGTRLRPPAAPRVSLQDADNQKRVGVKGDELKQLVSESGRSVGECTKA